MTRDDDAGESSRRGEASRGEINDPNLITGLACSFQPDGFRPAMFA
jgi:hypothetical protein